MTHDELLAIIDVNSYVNPKPLLEVVKLHKPYETTPPWGSTQKYIACSICAAYTNDGEYFLEYPCPTIEIIELNLQ
jgi:hypothetical protein